MNEQENNEQGEGHAKGTSEKLWDATRKTFHTATFRANQYKRVVQKKIDLASLHKKIANIHADLGKMIDDNREAGETDILATDSVQSLFQKLDSLKQAAATLEEEIETIKLETPPEEEKDEEAPPETT